MNLPVRSLILTLTLAASSLLTAATAHAQTGTPQSPYVITSAPYRITKPGYYILGNNLNYAGTSGNIITVSTNNVTLDFNGFYLAGPASNTSQTTYGVYAYESSNVTVKNGTVAYCYVGISLHGNQQANTNAVGEVIDNMRVTYCTYIGIDVEYCPASRITNCQVSQTGYSGAGQAIAIYGYGPGVTIQNNVVSTVTGTTSYGIYAGICFARQNTISNATYGIVGGNYQDNLTIGCTTNVTGGTDAGGNY